MVSTACAVIQRPSGVCAVAAVRPPPASGARGRRAPAPSTSAVPHAHRCADHAAARASRTSSSRAPAGRSPNAAAASIQRPSAAIRCPAPRAVFFGAKSTSGASVRSDTSGCTSTTRSGSAATASQSRIFAPMWKVCRLIARPVSRRATAHASSYVRAPRAPPAAARGTPTTAPGPAAARRPRRRPAARPGGQPERDVDPDRRAPGRRRQHLGGASRRPTTRRRPPRHPRDHPAARAPRPPRATAPRPMGQDGSPCASTSAPTTPASSSRPT